MKRGGVVAGESDYVDDGTVDLQGRPALKSKSGGWKACPYILCKHARNLESLNSKLSEQELSTNVGGGGDLQRWRVVSGWRTTESARTW